MIQTIFNYAVSILIFLSATAYVSGQGFGDTQLMVFKILAPIIWILSLSLKGRSVINKWWNIAIAIIFISFLLLNNQAQPIAALPMLYLFVATILYYALSSKLQSLEPVLNGIIWVVAAQAIMVFLQAVGLDPVCMNDSKNGVNTHMVGLFGYKYVFGAWMAIATPALLFNRKQWWGILSFILCLCSMSIAPIGLMIACILFGIIRIKGKKWVLPSILILTAFFALVIVLLPVFNQQSLYHKAWLRIHLESKFLPTIFQKPLTGWGLGSFKFIGPTVWNINTGTYGSMVDGWNDYLERGVELGLPIIFVMVGLFVDAFKRFMRKGNVGLFASLLIIPFGIIFHNYMNHASLCVLMICLYAGAYELYEI